MRDENIRYQLRNNFFFVIHRFSLLAKAVLLALAMAQWCLQNASIS
jgi:hypothetical protein